MKSTPEARAIKHRLEELIILKHVNAIIFHPLLLFIRQVFEFLARYIRFTRKIFFIVFGRGRVGIIE